MTLKGPSVPPGRATAAIVRPFIALIDKSNHIINSAMEREYIYISIAWFRRTREDYYWFMSVNSVRRRYNIQILFNCFYLL